MAQYFPSLYKVTPTINGANIQLAVGDHFAVKGKGYTLQSVLSVATSSLAKNTLYYVYAQVVTGTLSLTYLTTPPSSNTDKTLVTAFLSSDATTPVPTYLLNIEGSPTSTVLPFTSSIINTGSKGVSSTGATYKMFGDSLECKIFFLLDAVASGSATTTAIRFSLPTNLSITEDGNNNLGQSTEYSVVTNGQYTPSLTVFPFNTTSVSVAKASSANFYSIGDVNIARACQFNMQFIVKVSGWSSTPLINR